MKGTLTHPAGTTDAVTLLREGWSILVEQLGVRKATEFAVLLERGHGDSVEDITRYWGEASIDEIHERVLSWKHTQQQETLPSQLRVAG